MSDDTIEFKDPKITVTRNSDDPVLHEILKTACIDNWEKLKNELGETSGINESQVLTGIISMYTGFLSFAYGPEHTVTLLEELLRRARTEVNLNAH